MVLPVENLTVKQLAMERADRKAKAAALPAGTAGQGLLRDITMALVESRVLAEDSLLADRAALTAADAATVRLVGIRRRVIEQQIKYAARMKVTCVKGLEFAGRMFEVQLPDVEGLTEDEIKIMKAPEKEAESRKKEASEEKKGTKEARFRPYPASWPQWLGVQRTGLPSRPQLNMPQISVPQMGAAQLQQPAQLVQQIQHVSF
jgi:hypothetical protein